MTSEQQPPAHPPSLTAVMQRNMKSLMAIPGVTGVGEGSANGKPCILVLVNRKTSAVEHRIPAELEGYPVSVESVGTVRAR